MVEIGGKPILWHIMKSYGAHGINEFIVCCGYKGFMIKKYFRKLLSEHMSDVTFDMRNNDMQVHHKYAEPWKVTLVDTGEDTTGGRLRRVRSYVENEEAFCFTYGDGVADIDISAQIAFHSSHGKLATVTAVQPPGRYGALEMNDTVVGDSSKASRRWRVDQRGYFVRSPKVIDVIDGDSFVVGGAPLQTLAKMGEFQAYRHRGFWQPMDTLRDKLLLEDLWLSGQARGKSGLEPRLLWC